MFSIYFYFLSVAIASFKHFFALSPNYFLVVGMISLRILPGANYVIRCRLFVDMWLPNNMLIFTFQLFCHDCQTKQTIYQFLFLTNNESGENYSEKKKKR